MYQHNFNILKGKKVIGKNFIQLEYDDVDAIDFLGVVDEIREMYEDNTLKIQLVSIEEL